MKNSLAKKLFGLLLASGCIITMIFANKPIEACDVFTMRSQFRDTNMKTIFENYCSEVEDELGEQSLEKYDDSNFFVRVLNKINMRDALSVDDQRVVAFMINMRDRQERRKDIQTIIFLFSDDVDRRESLLALIDPDCELRGVDVVSQTESFISTRKAVRRNKMGKAGYRIRRDKKCMYYLKNDMDDLKDLDDCL